MAMDLARDLWPRQEPGYSLDNPPADQFRTRYWTGAAMVGDWLYIDGGDVCSTAFDSEPCVLYSTIRRSELLDSGREAMMASGWQRCPE
jgi:hypothetical protein